MCIVDEQSKPLSAEDRQTLLHIARLALEQRLGAGKLQSYDADSEALYEQRAVFVTLRSRETGELRGCRGEIQARSPLIDAVARITVASATDDSRFLPVTLEELPDIHIEISALTPMQPIEPEEVEVGRHGLWIVQGLYSGLLLPQVAVRFGWDREQYLKGTCTKAGLPKDAWMSEGSELFSFETEVWDE